MWRIAAYLVLAAGVILVAGSRVDGDDMKYRDLTPEEEYVIIHGGTENPFTGEYVDTFEDGVITPLKSYNTREILFSYQWFWESCDLNEISWVFKRYLLIPRRFSDPKSMNI